MADIAGRQQGNVVTSLVLEWSLARYRVIAAFAFIARPLIYCQAIEPTSLM